MSGTFLLRLPGETQSAAGKQALDSFGLMTRHNHGPIRRRDGRCSTYDVLDERKTSGLMQHFRLAGLHARTESGSEDHDGNGLVHCRSIRMRELCTTQTEAASACGGRKLDGDAGYCRRVVSYYGPRCSQRTLDYADTHKGQPRRIVFDWLSVLPSVAFPHRTGDRSRIAYGNLHQLSPRVLVYGLHVVR